MRLLQKEYICLGLVLAFVVFLYFATGIGCPILYVTGIPCPGCGMSRACLKLLQLDFTGAFHYHPLCFILPIIAPFLLLRFYGKVSDGPYLWGLVLICILFFLVYFLRLKNPADTIVKLDLRDGMIGRIFNSLKQFFQKTEDTLHLSLKYLVLSPLESAIPHGSPGHST